jgi:phage gp46-like protein
MAKPDKGDAWYEINYGDFCGGDAKSEHCESYETAVKMVLLKPKKTNIAYQWWSDHKRLYTKPTNRGATWTNEHTNNHPEAGHLFVWG